MIGALLLAASLVSVAMADSCQYKVQSYTYNMTALRNDTGDFVVTDNNNHEYFMNFCGPLVKSINVTDCIDSNETQVCQVWDKGVAGVSCGKSDRVTAVREFYEQMPSLTLHIRGGTERFGVRAKSVVHLVCNGTATDDAPSFVREVLSDFEYHFVWQRAEVCAGPTPPPTSAPTTTITTPRPIMPPTTASNDTGSSTDETPSSSSSDGNSTSHAHSGHSHSMSGNETETGTTVNGTSTGMPMVAPGTLDMRLVIVLAVLGALVVVAIVVLVAVYLARRRKRLSGYQALMNNQGQEKFNRIE